MPDASLPDVLRAPEPTPMRASHHGRPGRSAGGAWRTLLRTPLTPLLPPTPQFWIHSHCDKSTSGDVESLADQDAYSCPNCRGERTTLLFTRDFFRVIDFLWLFGLVATLHWLYFDVTTVVVTVDTAGGKSCVAEVALLRGAFRGEGGVALYVLPFVQSLSKELE